jgi:hypothetical protein
MVAVGSTALQVVMSPAEPAEAFVEQYLRLVQVLLLLFVLVIVVLFLLVMVVLRLIM